MPDRESVIKELEALDKAMNRNQCYTCSHEFIDSVEKFGTNIIEDTIDLLKNDKSERLHFIEGTAKLVVENEMLKKQLTNRPEIVRCKECKYFNKSRLLCDHPTTHVYRTIMPDWYCADGKRE